MQSTNSMNTWDFQNSEVDLFLLFSSSRDQLLWNHVYYWFMNYNKEINGNSWANKLRLSLKK